MGRKCAGLSDLQNQACCFPPHYRFYVIVHDGDQNKSGGDCGKPASLFLSRVALASISGHVYDEDTGPKPARSGHYSERHRRQGATVLITVFTDQNGELHFH